MNASYATQAQWTLRYCMQLTQTTQRQNAMTEEVSFLRSVRLLRSLCFVRCAEIEINLCLDILAAILEYT